MPSVVEISNGGGARLRTRATIPDVPGLAAAGPMTHVEALNLEQLPEHLVILGGGYVGLEFAQAMRRFGSRITIVQRGRQLLDREDPDVADAVLELMRDEGIEVLLQATVDHVSGHSGAQVTLAIRAGSTGRIIEATEILVAAGRTPNIDRLDAAKGGVQLDPRGFIQVNERLQTSALDVWAMGDGAGSPMFTHVGFDTPGLLLLSVAMVSWEVLLSKGQEWDWFGDPFWRVQTLAAVFALSLLALIVRELRVKYPLINLRTLADRNFRSCCIIIFYLLRIRRALCQHHDVAHVVAVAVRL